MQRITLQACGEMGLVDAFFGLLFGIVSVALTNYYTNIAFLWFNVIGCLVTIVAGYLISLTVKADEK